MNDSKSRTFFQEYAWLVVLSLLLLEVILFSSARMALRYFNGQPDKVTVAEIARGKIKPGAFVSLSGVVYRPDSLVTSNTEAQSQQLTPSTSFLISSDDPFVSATRDANQFLQRSVKVLEDLPPLTEPFVDKLTKNQDVSKVLPQDRALLNDMVELQRYDDIITRDNALRELASRKLRVTRLLQESINTLASLRLQRPRAMVKIIVYPTQYEDQAGVKPLAIPNKNDLEAFIMQSEIDQKATQTNPTLRAARLLKQNLEQIAALEDAVDSQNLNVTGVTRLSAASTPKEASSSSFSSPSIELLYLDRIPHRPAYAFLLAFIVLIALVAGILFLPLASKL